MGFGIRLRRQVVFTLIGSLSAYPLGSTLVFLAPSAELPPWSSKSAHAAVLIGSRYLKIEKEDTLSQALDNHFKIRSWRLWGKNGAIARIAAMNPTIQDVNHLRPGMVIDIGDYGQELPSNPVAAPLPPAPAISTRSPSSAPDQPIETPSSVRPVQTEGSKEPPATGEVYGNVWVAADSSFSRIDAIDKGTGGTAIFLSNLTPGLRLSWGQHWSGRVQTSLDLGLRFESFNAPSGIQLNNATHTNADLGLSAKWIPFDALPRLAIQSGLAVRTIYFVRSESVSATRLDSAIIPGLTLGLRYRALEVSAFSAVLYAQGTVLLPSSMPTYTIQTGSSAKLGMGLTQNLSRHYQITGDLWYHRMSQDSSIATQSFSDIGLTFGLNIRFDAVTKPEELRRGDLP